MPNQCIVPAVLCAPNSSTISSMCMQDDDHTVFPQVLSMRRSHMALQWQTTLFCQLDCRPSIRSRQMPSALSSIRGCWQQCKHGRSGWMTVKLKRLRVTSHTGGQVHLFHVTHPPASSMAHSFTHPPIHSLYVPFLESQIHT